MQAKNLSEVFRDAQKYLWDGAGDNEPEYKSEFICHAIRQVYAKRRLIDSARKIVTDAIHPYYTFDDWLESQGIAREELRDDARVQAHRLQWLKLLEAQFKEG
jgi:hypothetical protein